MSDTWTNSIGSSGFNFNDILMKVKEFSNDNFNIEVIKMSAKTGEGIDELLNRVILLTK